MKRVRPRRIPPTQEQILARFKVPVTYLPFRVTHLDGTIRPWHYRAVNN